MLYETWRSDVLRSLAYMEALIDFGEDEQLDSAILDTSLLSFPSDLHCTGIDLKIVKGRVNVLQKAIRQHLDDGRRGEILRDGVHVAIIGPPNAGKSSFLNIMGTFLLLFGWLLSEC